ncbi:MAG: hypothetical protein V1650_03405 [Candidatus Omnitrophota bacterium]
MVQKKEFYRLIQISGAVIFIPAVLVVGPLSGYFVGDFLATKFALGQAALFTCIGLGFISSGFEVYRLIRFVIKLDVGNGRDRSLQNDKK